MTSPIAILLLAVSLPASAGPQKDVLDSLAAHAGGASARVLNDKDYSLEEKIEKLVAGIPVKKHGEALASVETLEAALRKKAGDEPLPADALSALGSAYLQLGDKDKAMKLAAHLVKNNDDDPRGHRLAAQTLLAKADEAEKRGEKSQAKDLRAQALEEATAAERNSPENSMQRSVNIALKNLISSGGGGVTGGIGATGGGGGSGTPEREVTAKDMEMTAADAKKLVDDLGRCLKFKDCRKSLNEVAPGTKDIKDSKLAGKHVLHQLFKEGFMYKGDPSKKVKGPSQIEKANNEKEGIKLIMRMSDDILKDPNAAADHARLLNMVESLKDKELSDEQINSLALHISGWKAALNTAYEMDSLNWWQKSQSYFTQTVNFIGVIMGGDIDPNKVTANTHGVVGSKLAPSLATWQDRGKTADELTGMYLQNQYFTGNAPKYSK